MSTIPETVCAHHAGMRVLGISCITNMAAGITGEPLNHEDVLAIGASVTGRAVHLIKALLPHL
jgi:purine-nucleoside phosphorylase